MVTNIGDHMQYVPSPALDRAGYRVLTNSADIYYDAKSKSSGKIPQLVKQSTKTGAYGKRYRASLIETYPAKFRPPTAYINGSLEHELGHYDYFYEDNYFRYRKGGQVRTGYLGHFDSGTIFDSRRFLTELGIDPRLIDTNLRNRVLTETMSKVSSGSFNAAVAAAEGSESIRQIANAMKNVLGLFRAVRKMDHKGIKRALEGLAKNQVGKPRKITGTTPSQVWLNIQYGWLPLLSDIYGAIEAFQNGIPNMGVVKVKSKRSSKLEKSFMPNTTGHLVTQYSLDIETYAETALWYRIDDPYLVLANQLGITNPLLVVWELVPFSFVIDWLLPVGTWLEALTSDIGCTFLAGYSTYGVYLEEVAQWRPKLSNTYGYSGKFPNQKIRLRGTIRDALSGQPIPKLYVKSPFSNKHTTSALALLDVTHKRK